MTLTRAVLAALWLALGLVPVAWWLRDRRRVDVWRALPVPAALLAADGSVRDRTGPVHDGGFRVASGLPAPGQVVRARDADGTWLALGGVRGGALAVALPGDAVADRRDRALADLGSRLAHDINTPLGALQGHLDLIAHEPISAAAHASVRTCQRELARLQTTAQDLLAFTRLRAGGGTRSRQPAGALAEEAAAALLDTADRLGVELTVAVPTEPVQVLVAEADLVRALRNLISNALTHGAVGPDAVPAGAGPRRVHVDVAADPDTVTFTVEDSGRGLTASELEELSRPLVRGEATEAGRGPGSGLGLAIVAEVLAGHGSALRPLRARSGRAALAFSLPRVA